MMFSNVLSPNNSLLPPSPIILSDEEILEYFPHVSAIEIEQLKLDILVITEILYNELKRKPDNF
jgi:hypothetical protein